MAAEVETVGEGDDEDPDGGEGGGGRDGFGAMILLSNISLVLLITF